MRCGNLSLLAVAACAGAVLSGAAPLRAEMSLCNGSDRPLRMAQLYLDEAGQPRNAEGLGVVAPADCRNIGYSEDGMSAYHIHADGLTPQAPHFSFCLPSDPFFFVKVDEPCEGETRADYFRIEMPAGEGRVVLSLDGAGGFLPLPALPMIDAGAAFVAAPAADAKAKDEAGTPAVTGLAEAEVFDSGLAAGDYGPAFEIGGIWDGCADRGAGLECRFYGMLTRFVARDGDAYPPDFLADLAQIPRFSAVSVAGDVLVDGGHEVEAALSQVRVETDNPLLGIYQAIQGGWLAEDGTGGGLFIEGSEASVYAAGALVAELIIELDIGCDGGEPLAPSMKTLDIASHAERCGTFDELTDTRMVIFGENGAAAYTRR